MSKRKPYEQMTTSELAAATAKYDKPFVALRESKPLTPGMRRMHASAAKRGRPRIGKGSAKLYVSMERGLLKRVDAFARAHGISRSQLIARGVRAVLNSAA